MKNHPIPPYYESHDTDFGTVIIRAYNGEFLKPAARRKCSKDANYLHLPIPVSEAQNQWYWDYAIDAGVGEYWLGISSHEDQSADYRPWYTDNGDLQNYTNWGEGEPDNANDGEPFAKTGTGNGKWFDEADNGLGEAVCTYIIESTRP